MTDPNHLVAFDHWLRAFGEDVLSLSNLLESREAPAAFRRASAEALTQLLRSAPLIPEGVEVLGYLELAFAFRVIARRALGELGSEAETEAHAAGRIQRLAADMDQVVAFLGSDLPRLEERVLTRSASGEPAADELLEDDTRRAELLEGARRWAELSPLPELRQSKEELVKIESFFRTRLRPGEE